MAADFTTDFSFGTEPLSHILPLLAQALQQSGEVTCTVPDPNLGAGLSAGLYAGELTAAGIHRPLMVWLDAADALDATLMTPEAIPPTHIRLRFCRRARQPAPDALGYGAGSEWGRVNKLEDPIFLLTFTEALRRVNPPAGGRVLALGVNAGRELDALVLAFPGVGFDILGLDLDDTALEQARLRHPAATFRVLDVRELEQVQAQLGQFDLILALSLLQSPGIQQDALLKVLRGLLTVGGGLILGYPNARYRGGELSYGARMKNFERPDLSLLMADVTDARRRLQKYGYKVFVTGKYEVLLTAIPAGKATPPHHPLVSNLV